MNNDSQFTLIQNSLERYRRALNGLDSSADSPNKNDILEIISARDNLEKVLATEKEIPTNIFSELIALDAKFKVQAYRIKESEIDLTEYRQFLPVNSQTWLFAIAKAQKSHRFDWWLKGAKIIIWTINLALLTTLATRFLSGSSGFLEIALVAFPGVLSLLQFSKDLKKQERKRFHNLLNSFHGFPDINAFRRLFAIFTATLFSAIVSSYGLLLGFG